MSCTSKSIKYTMMLFNLAFMLLGAAVLAVGLTAKYDKDFGQVWGNVRGNAIVDASYINNLSLVLVAAGGFTFILGIIGLVGSAWKIRALLVIYLILIVVLLLVKLALLFIVVQFNSKFADSLHKAFNSTVTKLAEQNKNGTLDSVYMTAMSKIEPTLKCCGLQGPSDYDFIDIDIPSSCYPNNSTSNHDGYYTAGCGEKFITFISAHVPLITYVLIAIIFVEFTAIAFATFLCCHKKRKELIDFE